MGKQHKLSKQQSKKQDHVAKVEKRAQNKQTEVPTQFKKKNALGLPNLDQFKKKIIKSYESKKPTQNNIHTLELLKSKNTVSQNYKNLNNINETFVPKVEEHVFQESDPFLREKKKFKSELKKVIEASDIILEILDARDPIGCRNKEIEALIQSYSQEKKIILVVNKIDLVPIENAEAWLTYLRREYATVLFKANTQNQSDRLGGSTLFKKSFTDNKEMVEQMLNSNKAMGADNLLQLIKNYSKKEGIKQAVSVGMVGYPNVGKSSIINSMKRSKAVGVSSVPGYTKMMQEISLDKKVKLLDCPGIVFSGDDEVQMVLRNIIKVDDIKDVITPISKICEKVGIQAIKDVYKVEDFNSTTELLMQIGTTRGQLQRGGTVDLEKAAKIILNDWNSGKIRYFTKPPVDQVLSTNELEQLEPVQRIQTGESMEMEE